MELRDFVEGTINQIVEGVLAAQVAVGKKGGIVNPTRVRLLSSESEASFGELAGKKSASSKRIVQAVRFSLVVTAASTQSSEGGGGVRIAIVEAGIQQAAAQERGTESRIEFVVPLVLPSVDAFDEEDRSGGVVVR